MSMERAMLCGPCMEPTPHAYTGDMWRCSRCLLREKDATIKALADALDRRFGRHDSGCLTKKNPGCVCGLDAALRLAGRL